MFDFFIGKTPSTNRQMERDPLPIPKIVRKMLQVAKNNSYERRKNTSERRRRGENPDFVVDLSKTPQRRIKNDRRQKLDALIAKDKFPERRKNRLDRRHLVNEGIVLQLSSTGDRRKTSDRRRSPKPYPA